jgi:hypothetical protein
MFQLEVMKSALLQETRKVWDSQLDLLSETIDIPYSRYEQILDFAQKYVDPGDNGALIIYGVVRDGEQHASAILEMTNARCSRDPSLKLLNMYLQPQLNIDLLDTIPSGVLSEINDVITASLSKAVTTAFSDHGLRKLKAFGRNDEMRGFFDSVIAKIGDSDVLGLKVYRQSSWLVFERA